MENRIGALAEMLNLVKNRGINVHAVACRDKDDQLTHVMLRLSAANVDELINDFTNSGIRVIYNNS